MWCVFAFIHKEGHNGFGNHIIHCFADAVEVRSDQRLNHLGFHVSSWLALAWIIILCSYMWLHVWHVNGFYVFLHILIDFIIIQVSNTSIFYLYFSATASWSLIYVRCLISEFDMGILFCDSVVKTCISYGFYIQSLLSLLLLHKLSLVLWIEHIKYRVTATHEVWMICINICVLNHN